MILEILKKIKTINVIGNMPSVEPVPIPTKNINIFKQYLKLFSPRKWKLNKNYVLKLTDNISIFIPREFKMDFASIPRPLWGILAPTGPLLVGSCFHDFGYRYGGILIIFKNEMIFERLSKSEIDLLFKLITQKVNEITGFATIAETAVKVFGFMAWNANRKDNCNIYIDYPYIKKEI